MKVRGRCQHSKKQRFWTKPYAGLWTRSSQSVSTCLARAPEAITARTAITTSWCSFGSQTGHPSNARRTRTGHFGESDFHRISSYGQPMRSIDNYRLSLLCQPQSFVRANFSMQDERIQLVQQWMDTAREDLLLAQLAFDNVPGLLSGAVYHSQQAAEKVLKGFLAWHQRPLQRTHNLPELIGSCVEIDEAFLSLEAVAEVLNPYAFRFRYPSDDHKPSRDQATEAIHLARLITEFVRQRLPPEVHEQDIS